MGRPPARARPSAAREDMRLVNTDGRTTEADGGQSQTNTRGGGATAAVKGVLHSERKMRGRRRKTE